MHEHEHEPFICSNCEEVYSSRNQLFKHIRVAHQYTDNEDYRKDNSQDVLICFSDPWVLICSKPQGMSTQDEDSGPSLRRTAALLLSPEEITTDTHFRKARPVHRLDKCTGGLVVCAKTKEARVSLQRSFENRLVSKQYVAIVAGKLPSEVGVIEIPIQGKAARTDYRVQQVTPSLRFGFLTTVNLTPHTGRFHQLRRHMAYVGCPIVDDWRYSCQPLSSAAGASQTAIYLYAVELSIPHPTRLDECTGVALEVTVTIPEPEAFEALRRQELNAWEESGIGQLSGCYAGEAANMEQIKDPVATTFDMSCS